MYVRVYACVRTWGRSAAETLRHRLALFTQRGFFLLRDLLLLLVPFTAIYALLRAATFLAALAAACFLGQLSCAHSGHRGLRPDNLTCLRDWPSDQIPRVKSAKASAGRAKPYDCIAISSVAETSVTFQSEKDKDALRRTTTWTSSFVLTRPIIRVLRCTLLWSLV